METVGEKEKVYVEVLRVPYVKDFSEGTQRKCRKVKVGYVAMKRETRDAN